MKKQSCSILITVTFVFFAFTFGFFLGKNHNRADVQISVPASMRLEPTVPSAPEETAVPVQTITFPININSAGEEEFMALPGIGNVLALRILDYREVNGSFLAVEELMNVEGIGEKRFEEMLDLITTGG